VQEKNLKKAKKIMKSQRLRSEIYEQKSVQRCKRLVALRVRAPCKEETIMSGKGGGLDQENVAGSIPLI
jgi:hypothetical protein